MSLADTTATLLSILLDVSATFGPFGLGTTLHVLPSQWSVKVPLTPTPTAQMSLADTAAIPSKWAYVPFGEGTMLQFMPFQCSIKALSFPDPTAQMSLAETTATPYN